MQVLNGDRLPERLCAAAHGNRGWLLQQAVHLLARCQSKHEAWVLRRTNMHSHAFCCSQCRETQTETDRATNMMPVVVKVFALFTQNKQININNCEGSSRWSPRRAATLATASRSTFVFKMMAAFQVNCISPRPFLSPKLKTKKKAISVCFQKLRNEFCWGGSGMWL